MKHRRHIITILLMLTLVTWVFGLSGCSAGDDISLSISRYLNKNGLSAEAVEESMVEKISDYSTTLDFYNVSEETVAAVFAEVVEEHPEFFWLGGGYEYTVTKWRNGSTDISLRLLLKADEEDIPSMNAEFRETLNEILSMVDSSWSDYEKALFAHDYITENCSYDTELSKMLAEASADGLYEGDRTGTTAYGCLVNKLAVCSGYTAAFQLLMNELGISCGIVSGTTEESIASGGHVWNYITLDGENYYVDVTWDDAGESLERKAPPDHSYFCVTGEELYRSHKVKDDTAAPRCTAYKYNYHIRSGYYLDYYDFNAVSSLVDSQIDSGIIEIKFASSEAMAQACSELFGASRFFQIPSVSSRGCNAVWHRECDDSCVLIMWIK